MNPLSIVLITYGAKPETGHLFRDRAVQASVEATERTMTCGRKIFMIYDFVLRYKAAVSNPGVTTVVGPYVDGFGAGYVITLCRTLSTDKKYYM